MSSYKYLFNFVCGPVLKVSLGNIKLLSNRVMMTSSAEKQNSKCEDMF